MNDSITPQMGLFDLPSTQQPTSSAPGVVVAEKKKKHSKKNPAPKSKLQSSQDAGVAHKNVLPKLSSRAKQPRPLSGLVPAGDVRLTANIKEEIHLQMKIVAAQRRTTIGELIEELVENYLESPYGIKK